MELVKANYTFHFTSHLRNLTIITQYIDDLQLFQTVEISDQPSKPRYTKYIENALKTHNDLYSLGLSKIELHLKSSMSDGTFIETLLNPLIHRPEVYISYVYSPGSWNIIESRSYNTRDEAQTGHTYLCQKFE